MRPVDHSGAMKIVVKEDGEGYLAHVRGSDNLYAYGSSRKEALDELSSVIEMTMDYRLEPFRRLV